MAKAKSVYLNDDIVKQIDDIKPMFQDTKIVPTESMIISAALNVYKEYLEGQKSKESVVKTELVHNITDAELAELRTHIDPDHLCIDLTKFPKQK